MPRLSKDETKIKLDSLWKAFEQLKHESEGRLKNQATFDNILVLANENEKVVMLERPIGRTTLIQPRGKGFIELNKAITEYRKEHKTRKHLIPKKAKGKIESLEEQLQSALESAIKLQEKVHTLHIRLNNKEKQINLAEHERDEFALIIADLRMRYEH